MNLGQRSKISVEGNMSSMTDLVFLLLIFFIILSTLASNGVNVDLPESKGVNSVTSKLTLTIKPDMTYLVNGGPIAYEDVESMLTIKMEEQADKVLYLEVDKEVPTGATVEMIGMAKSHDWKVMLGASPKKE
ncbi:MAG: hypothetical protein RL226_48 [Bacteroidota bacterium]|jgi:biopolymer transport protein ExbD